MLQLCNDRLSLCLLPEAGGGIARFDWLGEGTERALMRPCVSSPERSPGHYDPNLLACYPLLPWSNRIAHGGFFHAGRRIALALNRDDDAWPIHGSAWQRRWNVRRHEADEAELSLDEASVDGYAYRARLTYRLDDTALRVRLRVTNAGAYPMPFGMGLHPFFPRDARTRLCAPAESVWVGEGADPLPTGRESIPSAWDFGQSVALPPGGLNHAFAGWSGHAVIEWPDASLRLHVEADADAYVIYVPEGRDFFCFEPVDHPINAVHLPGGAVANGMTELTPGESLERAFAFRVEAQLSEPERSIR
jgi:aldose 1-epimerase